MSPEEYNPSKESEVGELTGHVAGAPEVPSAFSHLPQTKPEQFGRMLQESRKTKETSEEKPKAAEPEGGRYDLQNRMAPSAVRAGMEMFKQYHPDYFKQMREAVGRTYWTDPLAEGEEEWEPVPVEEIDKDTGEDWKDTGEDWTHEDR
jgi:hypothetical protein